ncbi:MAG: hypothetical protein ACYCWE_16505 [Eubacteriales bacterium]
MKKDDLWEELLHENNKIISVDCSEEPMVQYFEIGRTHIETTDAGRYREAADIPLSRFGYRFSLRHTGKPHVLVLSYPDDRRRFMCVNDGTSYDLTTGVVTGCRNVVSGKMKTIYNVFWPRWTDESIVFSTWGQGEPAAVASFSVYELDSLPALKIIKDQKQIDFRSFGLQYEDPCNIGMTEGTSEFSEWLDHHISYMLFTGQNRLIYPVNWYHGPIVPVKCQPCERFNTYVAPDRRMYTRSTPEPSDWVDDLLTRFDREGLRFTGSMTLLRLGRLLEGMNNDLDLVRSGADTYNNMLFDDSIQSSCNDWTAMYNPRIFPAMIDAMEKGEPYSYAYGEQSTSVYSAPIFNPLHPVVQEQVFEYFGELADKYAHHASFTGLAINFWHATFLWYGSLRAGYDDLSIGMFERETGIRTGVDPKAPDRFSRRWRYITMHCEETFIAWRCDKIHEFLCRCSDMLISRRPDLTLTLTVWNEPSARSYLDGIDASSQYGARVSDYELYRRGGLDLRLFADDPVFEISVERNSLRDRGWGTEGVTAAPEKMHMFSDFAFLDTETQEILAKGQNSSSFLFNCWVEAWGKHTFFRCDPDDSNLDVIYALPDYKASFVFRENSTYEDDTDGKFWFGSQLRITSPFPASPYDMEWLANEVAAHDTLSLTAGGLYLDKAHAAEQREFAQAYRRLPKCKFRTLETGTDPVTVRWLHHQEKTYIYAVNREPYEIGLSVSLSGDTDPIYILLAPFGLFSFELAGNTPPCGFTLDVSEDIARSYRDQAAEAVNLINTASKKNIRIPGSTALLQSLSAAVKGEHWASVRHFLSSYIIAKTRECLNKI